ncbi:hypothetical protein C7C56_027085 [Massilia glaciei]|uniref:Uncharacterized protein n=1 Tax=Massilia glaciei TaxID=1524097 RepID=A0A2U2H9T3_9BURK|nr:hypothetical protein C7C56_027085 [Massilia glaciei]
MSSLDGNAGPGRPKGRKGRWIFATVAAVTICAGALAWVVVDTENENALLTEQSAVAPAQPAPASAPAPAPGPEPEPEVSAAVILDVAPDAPAIGGPEKNIPEGPALAPRAPSLAPDPLPKLLLVAPAPAPKPPQLVQETRRKPERVKKTPPNKSGRPVLAKKAPQRARKPAADSAADNAANKAADKAADNAANKAADKAADNAANKAADNAANKAADNDVILLAALVSHGNRQSAAARKLKQCGPKGSAKAAECRARLCAGSARNEAACKAVNKP